MDHFQRLKAAAWSTLLLACVSFVLLVLSAPVRAVGRAGGADHQYDCWAASSNAYPSYGGCAFSYLDIRDNDVKVWLQAQKSGAPNYDFSFEMWLNCTLTQSGSCTYRYTKTLISSGVATHIDNGLLYTKTTYVGPECKGDGYTLVGGNCFCSPGFEPGANGTCTRFNCSAAGTVVPGSEGKSFWNSKSGDSGFMGCWGGCLVVGAFGTMNATTGEHWIAGPLTHTGQICNPANQGGNTPDLGGSNSDNHRGTKNSCPAEQCPGSINGNETCVPCSNSSGGQYTKNGDTQDSGGTMTKTECNGGVCTTTETTVDKDGKTTTTTRTTVGDGGYSGDGNGGKFGGGGMNGSGVGGGSGSGNGNGKGEGSDFCNANPDDPSCTDEHSFGGDCESSFRCDGDAIQCAMAKEQYKRACQLFDTETDESTIAKQAVQDGDQPDWAPYQQADSTAIDFQSRIDTSDALGTQCPAGETFSVMGQSFVYLTSQMCDSLSVLGWIVEAFGMLVSIFIVFRKGV